MRGDTHIARGAPRNGFGACSKTNTNTNTKAMTGVESVEEAESENSSVRRRRKIKREALRDPNEDSPKWATELLEQVASNTEHIGELLEREAGDVERPVDGDLRPPDTSRGYY